MNNPFKQHTKHNFTFLLSFTEVPFPFMTAESLIFFMKAHQDFFADAKAETEAGVEVKVSQFNNSLVSLDQRLEAGNTSLLFSLQTFDMDFPF